MVITRWDPFREAVSLQSRMNSLFNDLSRNNSGAEENTPVANANFVPAVDIYEDEHKVVLKLEVPGIKQEDIDIRVENQTLSVRGDRKFEHEEEEENFHRIEHRYGSFYRAFTLPATVDAENIAANCDAGVLRIELQKRVEAKPKQIKVSVGSAKPAEATKQVEGKSQPAQSSAA